MVSTPKKSEATASMFYFIIIIIIITFVLFFTMLRTEKAREKNIQARSNRESQPI